MKTFQCQVNGTLSSQACGEKADQIYQCEEIGPHERHRVGEHTIAHALAGNGYACSSIVNRWDEALRELVQEVNGFVYHGDRANAIVDTVNALRDNPGLANQLLHLPKD